MQLNFQCVEKIDCDGQMGDASVTLHVAYVVYAHAD